MSTPAAKWFSCRDKECTHCGGQLREHECNCCSCNKKGHRIAWRCGKTCDNRSHKYSNRTKYGDPAASAWAKHRNHGVFCSKRCHDADAKEAWNNALKLETQYKWLETGKQLQWTHRAAKQRLAGAIASSSPAKASRPLRTSETSCAR